jgi:hypothetical protein
VILTSRIQDPVQAFMASFRAGAGAAHGKKQKGGALNVSSRRSSRRSIRFSGKATRSLGGLERQRARTPAAKHTARACGSKAHYCSPRSAHAREMCPSSMSHGDRAGDLVSFLSFTRRARIVTCRRRPMLRASMMKQGFHVDLGTRPHG